MEDNEKIFDSSPNQHPTSRFDSDEAWIKLTAKYLRDLPQQLDGIRATLEIKDYRSIKKQAHRIKGTSGTYHLDTISKIAARMERLADRHNTSALVSAINKARRLVQLETAELTSKATSLPESSGRFTNG